MVNIKRRDKIKRFFGLIAAVFAVKIVGISSLFQAANHVDKATLNKQISEHKKALRESPYRKRNIDIDIQMHDKGLPRSEKRKLYLERAENIKQHSIMRKNLEGKINELVRRRDGV